MLLSIQLAASEGGNLGEAIVVFLGLLAYLGPAILKRWQERQGGGAASDQGDADGEPDRPGRRKRRRPRGGGAFVEPKRDGKPSKRDVWRELLSGGQPSVDPRPAAPRPKPAPTPAPVVQRPEAPEPTLVELGHSLDDLHRELEERHEQLEQAHASLPSESGGKSLVSSALAALPAEDELEAHAPRTETAAPLVSRRRVTRALPSSPYAWRQAVVLSEVFGRPVSLRSPQEQPGRLPG